MTPQEALAQNRWTLVLLIGLAVFAVGWAEQNEWLFLLAAGNIMLALIFAGRSR